MSDKQKRRLELWNDLVENLSKSAAFIMGLETSNENSKTNKELVDSACDDIELFNEGDVNE